MLNKTKVIGVISDYSENKNNCHQYNSHPLHLLRFHYVQTISRICNDKDIAVIILPCDMSQVDKFLNIVDGLVFVGGNDIHPSYFNQEIHVKADKIDSNIRTDFEIAILNKAIEQEKAILGICRGMQLMNVALGGDLIQDIESLVDTKIAHWNENRCLEAQVKHEVVVDKYSLAHKIFKTEKLMVNSNHHQALGNIANDLIVTGCCPDDKIAEVVELKGYSKFFLGVQWHPEFAKTQQDFALIEAFCLGVG